MSSVREVLHQLPDEGAVEEHRADRVRLGSNRHERMRSAA
jgi:hypothetical protein